MYAACSRTTDLGDVEVGQLTTSAGLCLQRVRREPREAVGVDGPDELGKQRGEVGLERDVARHAARRGEHQLDPCRDVLERAVLQQPREQQVARLERLEVLGVLHLALREKARRLEVEQRRRDDEELARAATDPSPWPSRWR